MLKKLICVLFAVILCLGMVVSVSAAEMTYYLDEFGLKISIPSELYVFTKDTDADYAGYALFGYTKDSLANIMTSANCYLMSFNSKSDTAISIASKKSEFPDLSTFSDDELELLCSTQKNQFSSDGAIVSKSDIYQQAQTVFHRIVYRLISGTDFTNCIQYTTILDGNTIVVQFQALSREMTSTDEVVMQSVVDSIRFDSLSPSQTSSKANASSQKTSSKTASMIPKASSVASTAQFPYTDSETEVRLIVPANWSKVPLTETNGNAEVQFSSNVDKNTTIQYGSTDEWNSKFSLLGGGTTREDINSSYFEDTDIAEIFGVTTEDVTTVYYSGRRYFRFQIWDYEDQTGSSGYVTTNMIFYDNGYLYWFRFHGTTYSKYYADFEFLLNRVRYPGMSNSNASAQNNKAIFSTLRNLNSINAWLFIISIVLLFALPIIIYRYAIAKKPVESPKAMKITIFYGLAGTAVTALFAVFSNIGFACVGSVILWSFINYLMLVNGKKPIEQAATETEPQNSIPAWKLYGQTADSFKIDTRPAASEKDVVPNEVYTTIKTDAAPTSPEQAVSMNVDAPEFCYNCGAKLKSTSKFCPKCGTKTEKLGDE